MLGDDATLGHHASLDDDAPLGVIALLGNDAVLADNVALVDDALGDDATRGAIAAERCNNMLGDDV